MRSPKGTPKASAPKKLKNNLIKLADKSGRICPEKSKINNLLNTKAGEGKKGKPDKKNRCQIAMIMITLKGGTQLLKLTFDGITKILAYFFD
jgi:hypothetical protein